MSDHKSLQPSLQLLDQGGLLNRISNRIRQSLELQEIFTTTALEIRAFLGIDRVKVYKFHPDGSGEVVAESIEGDRLPSLLGLNFPAEDIPPPARELFVKTRQRVIMDVISQRKILSELDCLETGKILETEDKHYSIADPCHIQYLTSMGVAASLTLPILHQHQLWGLLACHHSQPRRFSESELQMVQLLVNQVSIAIAQSSLLSQARQKATHEATINQISRLLHSPLMAADIYQTVLEETVQALQGSGGRLYITATAGDKPLQLYTTGEQPTLTSLEEHPIWQDQFPAALSHAHPLLDRPVPLREPEATKSNNSPAPKASSQRHQAPESSVPYPYILENLYQASGFADLIPAFEATPIRSVLVVPLQYQQQCIGYLSLFRNHIDTETLWAGQCDQDDRNLRPRESFAAWREVKTNQAQPWTQAEVKLAQALGTHLYMALMQRRVENLIRHQASHDLLTGLPNRILFNDRLFLALTNARRYDETLAVLFLDLDRFKKINDTLGHAVGDQLLQKAAQRLASCLRTGDTLARWGGDEFTLLLPQIDGIEDVTKVAQRILKAISAPFCFEGQELHVSTSIGIVLAPENGEDAETVLKHADTAMYRAKQQGKNNYQFFAPAMNSQALEQLLLENQLHKALERQEFELYYQPQLEINTGQVVAMEALLRWQHPELGLVTPRQFIPLAEETGLIVQIGEWVLQTACAQNRAWQVAGLPPVRMAVNLSARQFQQRNLVKIVTNVLRQTGLEPQYLELEITESLVMQDVDFTISVLRELEAVGVQIAMDDFGTGYSSLGSLMHFPLHTLKIDQSFVRSLTTNPRNAGIIQSIISLGHGLDLKVIAEGVETLEQLKFLRSAKSNALQGYLLSQPVKATAATQFLSQQQQLTQLTEVIQAILAQPEQLSNLLQASTQALVEGLDLSVACIWTLNESESCLELQASAGLAIDPRGPLGRIPVDPVSLEQFGDTAQSSLRNALLGHSEYQHQAQDLTTFVDYPLIAEGSWVGMMVLFSPQPLPGTVVAQLSLLADTITHRVRCQQVETVRQQQTQRERLIIEVAQQIRQSSKLEEILNITVSEVRQLFGADRVLLYRVWPDGTGSSVQEAIAPGWPAILGRNFPAEVFPPESQALYRQGRTCIIPDVEQGNILPCLVEFLRQFQVRAKLVVPILTQQDLWGLLVVHECKGPRHWQQQEVNLLIHLASQVAIAIQQSELSQQLERLTGSGKPEAMSAQGLD